MSTESLTQGDRRGDAWRHAFAYFWLLFTAVIVLPDVSGRGWVTPLAIGLLAGQAGWYGYRQVAGAGRRSVAGSRVYLVGALGIWLLLVVVDSGFLVMGASVLAPYCFGRVRLALAVLAPCLASWLWQEAAAGGLAWYEVTVALLSFASGGAVAGYMGTLSRQNEERQRLIEQLRAAQSELAAAERQAGVLAERQRLARDIHDTLTQGFASMVMLLEAADASLAATQPAARHVAAALRSARDNLAESRRVVWALRPELLGDGQLPEATRELLTRLEDETGVRTELIVTGAPRHLDQDAETSLLRLIQEALANVRKHATAARVSATISYIDDVTVVDIQDNGVGFDVDAVAGRNGSGGLGLQAMRERAAELGGRLTVESSPGDGTTVVVELPAARAQLVAEAAR